MTERAGHVVQTYLPRSETFVYTLLRHQTDFQPVVFARFGENLDEFPIDSLRPLQPERTLRRRLSRKLATRVGGYLPETYAYELARELRATRCAILHAHFGPTGSRSVPVARRLGLPLVTTFYGRDISLQPPGRMRSGPYDSGVSYDELFRHGSRFICEGPVMAQALSDAGCPSDQIRVVPIGIDLRQFPFEVPVRATPFVILQAARFVEKKGIDLSIRALAVAKTSVPHAELWLLGDGDLRSELEALATELGVSDSVRFLGMLSHGEYQAVLRSAHVAIQPSRTAADGDTEGGAPTVLLEMQASGVPIVATKHADIPSVVSRADRLVEEEDVEGLAAALVEVASISDEEYRDRAEQGRAFVEDTHDARITAKAIAAAYREVVKTR